MKSIDLNQYTEKLVEKKINDEVDRRMELKVAAVTKFITTLLYDSLRRNKIGGDRADKIIQDMIDSME